ncbi:hypothetical protein NQ314_016345 [Rhamnusium bicolor]|uniref:BESS domain-containing protein n=1 Tax=Rhamnusium bicolor TaxID=1586634 RepID=A0AAV8WWM0_9CUCU|nr:hypothetical protein NQ314_016345 [Rhamnusium bicolor]
MVLLDYNVNGRACAIVTTRNEINRKTSRAGLEHHLGKNTYTFNNLVSCLLWRKPDGNLKMSSKICHLQLPLLIAEVVQRSVNQCLKLKKQSLSYLKTSQKKMVQQDDDDSDKSDSRFLLSLLLEFRSIKEEFKLDLKMEMLSLIKKYKNLNI